MTDPIEAAIEAAAKVIDPLAFEERGSCPPRGYEFHTPEQLSRTIAARKAHALRVAKRIIAAYEAAKWRPIEEAPHMRKIIVTYHNEAGKRRTVMACYYEDHALEMHDDYADVGVWDEATGDSFAPAGWYEEIDHEGDIYPLGGDPEFWQPLPEPPAAQEGE